MDTITQEELNTLEIVNKLISNMPDFISQDKKEALDKLTFKMCKANFFGSSLRIEEELVGE
jgi:hypothetical protein